MKTRKITALLLALAMMVSVLAACNNGGNNSSATSSETSTASKADSTSSDTSETSEALTPEATGMYPGTTEAGAITTSVTAEPPDMNTITSTDALAHNLMRHLYTGLVTYDEKDLVVPGVAEDWTMSEDGLVYTFNLREDAKWSNGDTVTANDFYFAWSELLNPEVASEYAYFAYIIENAEAYYKGEAKLEDVGMKVVDDYTFEVTLKAPTAYALDSFAFAAFAPVNQKFYEEVGADKYNTEVENFCTNGAYNLDSWVHDDSLVFAKNEEYYDAANTASIKKITFKIIADANTGLNAFQAGELDMMQSVTGDQTTLLEGEGYPVQSYNDGSSWYLEYNLNVKGMDNVKIRKAIGLAVDKEAFIASILKNKSTPATSYVPAGMAGLKEDFEVEVGDLYPTTAQIDEAKKLLEEGLAEAGMTAEELSANLNMLIDDTTTAKNIGAFMQEQLRANLGLDLEIQSMTFKERLARMTAKDFVIVMAGWGPDYNDPNTFMDLWITDGGNNHTSYANPAYDKLIADAALEVNAETRMGYFYDAEKILAEDVPMYPIYWRKVNFVTSEKLQGVVRTIFQDFSFLHATIVE